MLAHPTIGVAVADSVVEVLPVRVSTEKAIPGRRRESQELVSLSRVELKAQDARVGVVSRGVECLASDVERHVRAGDGLGVGRNVAPLHRDAPFLALAFGSKATSRAKQCKPTQGTLSPCLLGVRALQAGKPLGERHA